LFEEISSCSLKDVLNSSTVYEVNGNEDLDELRKYKVIANAGAYSHLPQSTNWWGDVPTRYRHRSLLWMTGQVLKYFMRPRKFILDMVEQERKRMNWTDDDYLIGVHARQSDKPRLDKNAIYPLEHYMPTIRSLACKYRTNKIFVATESPEVIADTMKYPEYEWYWAEDTRRNLGASLSILEGTQNGFEQGVVAIKNLHLMLSPQIGPRIATFSSNWGRLIFELVIANTGPHYPPFVSLDNAYGSNNKMHYEVFPVFDDEDIDVWEH